MISEKEIEEAFRGFSANSVFIGPLEHSGASRGFMAGAKWATEKLAFGANSKRYAEALEWRDWQTCDLICEEHHLLMGYILKLEAKLTEALSDGPEDSVHEQGGVRRKMTWKESSEMMTSMANSLGKELKEMRELWRKRDHDCLHYKDKLAECGEVNTLLAQLSNHQGEKLKVAEQKLAEATKWIKGQAMLFEGEQKKLAEAEDVLEFYGSLCNWEQPEIRGYIALRAEKISDCDVEKTPDGIFTGGRRARKALGKIKGGA